MVVTSDPARSALEVELGVAVDAAVRAGRLQMERYERLERIVHKSDHDVVTEVDELSEQLIMDAVRGAYPDDAFLAEESGHSDASAAGADGAASDAARAAIEATDGLPATRRLWVVDPLDGTVNYANGIPIFCVSIGLVADGRPVLGVVHDPVRAETFTAVAGAGAWLDGVPIRMPAKERLSDMVLSLALPAAGWATRERRIRRRIRVARVLGSAALSLTYVANGRFDGFIQGRGLSPWDICAAGLIAAEGGARVTGLDGGEWFDAAAAGRSKGLVAAPPAHHSTLLEMLA